MDDDIIEYIFSPEEKVERRIACDEVGYPCSEARFFSVREYLDYLKDS